LKTSKTMKKIVKSIILLMAILLSKDIQSQFTFGPGNLYGITTTAIQKIGIGNFPANGDVSAKLHLNHFRLNANAVTNGFLFRTDGDQAVVNRWQMFTGTSSTIQTERYRLWTDALATPWVNQTADNALGLRLLTPNSTTNNTPFTRLQINGNKSATINGFSVSTTGYTLLTNTNTFLTSVGAPQTPFSLLHLAGSGPNFQTLGYRPWMADGITITSNNDASYMGHRSISNDLTETTFSWSDNYSDGGNFGADYISFRFTAGDGLQNSNLGDLNGRDSDGREILRLQPNGNIGIGPKFGVTQTTIPQSDLHIHAENNPSNSQGNAELGFTKASFQMTLEGITGQGDKDGFIILSEEFGPTTQENGTVFFRQLENRSMRFESVNLNPLNGFIIGERLRITSLSDTITTNPGLLPRATTRLAVSARGNSPLQRPLSTLHIGENMNIDNDGWRSWMNIGTLNSKRDKHCFFGLQTLATDTVNNDAIVAWGKQNYTDGASNLMPLKFVFSSEQIGSGNYTPGNITGREVARMESNGNVGIGTQAPDAKLDVYHDCVDSTNTQYALRSQIRGGTGTNYAGHFTTTAAATSGGLITYGVYALSEGSPDKNYGGYFEAKSIPGSTASHGLTGSAVFPTASASHIGVIGQAANTSSQIGVRGTVISNNFYNSGYGVSGLGFGSYDFGSAGTRPLYGVIGIARTNFCGYSPVGVYGQIINMSPNCPNGYAGYFEGETYVNGPLTATTYNPSDEMLKSNITEITEALELINQLKPVTYNYNCEQFPNLNLEPGLKHGFIAQQAEEVIPGITKQVTSLPIRDENDNVISEGTSFLTMNYTELHAVEIAAIKELQTQINELKEQLNACCSANSDTRGAQLYETNNNQFDITLSNSQSIILNQNVPNPFAEQTVINYRIDEDFSRAQILFYDVNGKLIQTSDIKTKGACQLNVFADDLTSGLYSYVLVVDGKIIDTKKMVKK